MVLPGEQQQAGQRRPAGVVPWAAAGTRCASDILEHCVGDVLNAPHVLFLTLLARSMTVLVLRHKSRRAIQCREAKRPPPFDQATSAPPTPALPSFVVSALLLIFLVCPNKHWKQFVVCDGPTDGLSRVAGSITISNGPNWTEADRSPASYYYETTVAGALPVISTLQVS